MMDIKSKFLLLASITVASLVVFGAIGCLYYPVKSRGMYYDYTLTDEDSARLNVSGIMSTLQSSGYNVTQERISEVYTVFTIISSFEPKQEIDLVIDNFSESGPRGYSYSFDGVVEYDVSIIPMDPRIEYDYDYVMNKTDTEVWKISVLLNLSGTFSSKSIGDNDFDSGTMDVCCAAFVVMAWFGVLVTCSTVLYFINLRNKAQQPPISFIRYVTTYSAPILVFFGSAALISFIFSVSGGADIYAKAIILATGIPLYVCGTYLVRKGLVGGSGQKSPESLEDTVKKHAPLILMFFGAVSLSDVAVGAFVGGGAIDSTWGLVFGVPPFVCGLYLAIKRLARRDDKQI